MQRSLAIALTLFCSLPVLAQDLFTFTKIADSNTSIPGTTSGAFDVQRPFFDAVIDGDSVVFIGSGSENGQRISGVYLERGGILSRVADTRTLMPGTDEVFDGYDRVFVDGETVAFSAIVVSPPLAGVYRATGGGPLEIIADSTTPIPGDSVNFRNFGDVAVAGEDLLFGGGFEFHGFVWHQDGLFRATSNGIVPVIDGSTPIPQGTGNFSLVGEIDLDETGFAFALPRENSSVDDGLYKFVGGQLERVADLTTMPPGGTLPFNSLRRFSYDQGEVAFVATTSSGSGVYADRNGTLELVADNSTVVPSVGRNFAGFSNRVAFSEGRVAFIPFWNPPGSLSVSGLFLADQGVIHEVLREGEVLDGRVIEHLNISPGAMSAVSLVAEVGFADGHEALYKIGLFVDEDDCRSSGRLCLNQDRFRVEVDWQDFEGNTGIGQRVGFRSEDSGLFWFFDPDNWEVLVKVLDGCPINGHFWVFTAATTNVQYTLRVTDLETGQFKEYSNALGASAPAVTDITAFASCP